MTILVIGTPDSGKSIYAESLAEGLSGGKEKLYIATMIPYGEEGNKRVEKHRRMREGKGFITLECPLKLEAYFEEIKANKSSCILLECLTNLVGNEIYDESHKGWTADRLSDYIINELLELCKLTNNAIIVTNYLENDADGYDDETRYYVNSVNSINEKLKAAFDEVHDNTSGQWRIYEAN